jgi:hypothetical protein
MQFFQPASYVHRLRHLGAVLGAACMALVAPGCGSQSPRSGGTAGGSPTAAAFRFSACMRAHGLPNFPDPHVFNSDGHHGVGIAVTPAETSSPAFKAAQTACAGIMPAPSPSEIARQQHAEEQGKLAFARCMRGRGISSFPDPTAQGQLKPAMVIAAGIDMHAPRFISSAEACAGASHGTITKAQIDAALKGG